jgi:hypothetical protein
MGCPFGDVNRNGDAHFCPRTCPAPYTESRTDIFRPLTCCYQERWLNSRHVSRN